MSTSVRINLLPHREQKRVARQSFLAALMATGVASSSRHFVRATRIDNQTNRNALLKTGS